MRGTVVGKLRIAPGYADFLLLYRQLAGFESDIVVTGGQSLGGNGVAVAHITILAVAAIVGQRAAENIFRFPADEAIIGHAIVGRCFPVGDGLILGGDSEGCLCNGAGNADRLGI